MKDALPCIHRGVTRHCSPLSDDASLIRPTVSWSRRYPMTLRVCRLSFAVVAAPSHGAGFPLPSLVFVAASSHDAGGPFCCLYRLSGRHEMPHLQLRGGFPRTIMPQHLRDGRGPPVAVLFVAASSHDAGGPFCCLYRLPGRHEMPPLQLRGRLPRAITPRHLLFATAWHRLPV